MVIASARVGGSAVCAALISAELGSKRLAVVPDFGAILSHRCPMYALDLLPQLWKLAVGRGDSPQHCIERWARCASPLGLSRLNEGRSVRWGTRSEGAKRLVLAASDIGAARDLRRIMWLFFERRRLPSLRESGLRLLREK